MLYEKRFQINLILQLMELEEQTNLKASRKYEIIRIRAVIK